MAIELERILGQVPGLHIVRSKQFFPDVEALSHIGFIPLWATDIYIDTSFYLQGNCQIFGALLSTFTKDNVVDNTFICYRIPLTEQYLTQSPLAITLHQNTNWILNAIRSFFVSIPWLPFVIFNLLFLLLPAAVNSVFMVINILGIIVIAFYYLGAFAKFIFKYLNEKSVIIEGQNISYENQQDLWAVTEKEIKALMPLSFVGIQRVALYKQSLYIVQPVLERDVVQNIRNITQDTSVREQKILDNMQKILEYLASPLFVSVLFGGYTNGEQSATS